jgi:AraC family transcriptional regulator, transcriptional activator of pobA
MPKASAINTYDTNAFREKYIEPQQVLNSMLKPDFDKFFIVPVQDMIRLMKLPVPPVRTTTNTIIFLTEGDAVMTIGSDTYTIFANECLVVPAGQVFSFNNVDLNKGYLCNFHQDLITTLAGQKAWLRDMEFLQVWANPCIKLDEQTAGFVQNLLQRLLVGYTEGGITDKPLIQSYLLALLCEINRVALPASRPAETQAVHIARKFRTLVHTHFKSKHRVADYAALLHVSPNHLNKAVKAATTKSPTKWIDEAIVLEAKVLLYQSHRSISEIAAEVGLQDPSYFARLFKKYEGI